MTGSLKIGIIGSGKVGTATAVLLAEAGYEIGFICDQNRDALERASERVGVATKKEVIAVTDPKDSTNEVDLIFITTPDRSIETAARELARRRAIRPGHIVVHMSGSLTSDVLSAVRERGAHAASLHPLQSFADFDQAKKNIPGSIFCIEGDEQALPILKEIVGVLKGRELRIPKEEKPLYHAGAVVASNFLVSLVWVSLLMYEKVGLDKKAAFHALLPLIGGTLRNIETLGAPEALTGPIVRGDIDTVRNHLAVIQERFPEFSEFYRIMGRITVELARENRDVEENALKKILDLLSSPT